MCGQNRSHAIANLVAALVITLLSSLELFVNFGIAFLRLFLMPRCQIKLEDRISSILWVPFLFVAFFQGYSSLIYSFSLFFDRALSIIPNLWDTGCLLIKDRRRLSFTTTIEYLFLRVAWRDFKLRLGKCLLTCNLVSFCSLLEERVRLRLVTSYCQSWPWWSALIRCKIRISQRYILCKVTL